MDLPGLPYGYISGIILRSMEGYGFAGSAIWDPGRPGSLVVVVVVVVMVVVVVVVVRKVRKKVRKAGREKRDN